MVEYVDTFNEFDSGFKLLSVLSHIAPIETDLQLKTRVRKLSKDKHKHYYIHTSK